MVYLDHCASAPMFPQVNRTMCRIMTDICGNPGAVHNAGAEARGILNESRRTLSQLLEVQDWEVFFTSGGTESNNWAIKSGCMGCNGRHIVVSAVEHKSVLLSAEAMKRQGFSVTLVQPDSDGIIQPEAICQAIRPDTVLLSVQAANNETGVLQDVETIAALAHKHHIRFHCDAVQSFGHIHQKLNKADLISVSAHKLGGPVGMGALVIRGNSGLTPLIDGGGQERNLRSGTENVAGAAGFAMAAQMAINCLDEEQGRLFRLREQLFQGIRQAVPQVILNGINADRLPGVLNCRFPGIASEEMVMRLDLKGICVSPGAACAARSPEPSHVLLAMGLSAQQAKESVRFSLGFTTTDQDIQFTVQAIEQIMKNR